MRLVHRGSRPSFRSSSAACAWRCVLTHVPRAGSSANLRGTVAWPCFFANRRSAAKRSSHASGFTSVHSNPMRCSFLMRAAVMRLVHGGSRPSFRSSSAAYASRCRLTHLLSAASSTKRQGTLA